jgi:hypothetical protein
MTRLSLALLALASALMAVATVIYVTHRRRHPDYSLADYLALCEEEDGLFV